MIDETPTSRHDAHATSVRRAANETSWTRWLPGLRTLRTYDPAWLRYDLVAGIVMTTMLVPVGIA